MLTDNDKQRIEQEANKWADKWQWIDEFSVKDVLIKIAEYATIYEREQQAKERTTNQKLINQSVMSERGMEFLKDKEKAYQLVEDQGRLLKEYEKADNEAAKLLSECKTKILKLEAERSELMNRIKELEKENKTLKGILKNELLDDSN